MSQKGNGDGIIPAATSPAMCAMSAISCECYKTFSSPTKAGSAKANGREPKTSLGRVFIYKLGCIATPGRKCMVSMQPLLKL
jgi:hypothetical protein